jgi:isochorismate synthase
MPFVVERRAVHDADPLAWWAASGETERFFWSRDDAAIAACGALACVESAGDGRFAAAARDATALAEAVLDPLPRGAPLLVGGFAFDAEPVAEGPWRAFPALRFWLPRRLLVRRGDSAVLHALAPIPSRADEAPARAALREALARETAPQRPIARATGEAPPAYRVAADCSHAAFRALVGAARDAVVAGALEKLVVARSVRIAAGGPIDAAALLAALRRAHPRCTSFAVARGERCFLGASPERLVALAGRDLETAALAGSAPRGATPEEDARLGAELRESKKEQEEHAVVVRAIRGVLAPLCETLSVPEAPRLLRLHGIQHLETPVHGRLARPAHVLALVERLHPTPAVAGAPRAAALAWLAAHEGLARGWYAGGIGWLDAHGGGDLAVALRCALVEAGAASLFAGAGVVAGSDPQAELLETRLKLRALVAPLLEI